MPEVEGDPEAIAIHRQLVEVSRLALLHGDFETYLKCFHTPNYIMTWEGVTVFDSEAEMRRLFDGTRANLTALDVTRYERTTKSAWFLGPTKLEATHESQMWSHDRMASPPSIAHSIVELIDGYWRVTVSRYEVAGKPILSKIFSSGRAMTPEEAAELGWGD